MKYDEFVAGAREMIAGYVNASLPELAETLLGQGLDPAEVEPMEVIGTISLWSMLADTALPDGRTYRVEYDRKNGSWSLTAYPEGGSAG